MAYQMNGFYSPTYYGVTSPDPFNQHRGQYQPQTMSMPQPPQTSNDIIWVQGEAGAKSYLVGANNTVLLMDSENSTFYLKSADASGMPLPLRIFDYTERTLTPATPPEKHVCQCGKDFVKLEDFKTLEAKFETLANEFKSLSNNTKEGT